MNVDEDFDEDCPILVPVDQIANQQKVPGNKLYKVCIFVKDLMST